MCVGRDAGAFTGGLEVSGKGLFLFSLKVLKVTNSDINFGLEVVSLWSAEVLFSCTAIEFFVW